SRSTVVCSNEPGAFVEELHRRWCEGANLHAVGSPEKKPPAEMPPGAFFISYSRDDIASARTLYEELTREGLPAWRDAGLQPCANWKDKLTRNIENCSFILPLISEKSRRREQGEFRVEWHQAAQKHQRFFGTGTSPIVPIVVDADDTNFRQFHNLA